jgi:hypothetical protein
MGNIGILIPIMIFAIPLLAIWTKHQQKIAEMQGQTGNFDNGERDAAYASKLQALEDRVRVLERIVTDNSNTPTAALAREIEALRDNRALDQDAGTALPLVKDKEQV